MKVYVLALTAIVLMSSIVFAEDNYENALSLYRNGEYKAAVEYLKEYVEKTPDPHAYYLLGYAHYKMKNHTEAMKYFKDAYVIDPTFSPLPSAK